VLAFATVSAVWCEGLYRSIIQWNSEWKTFELLRIEDIVRIEISSQSHKDNYGKCYKARAVLDWRKEGQQENPEDGIKCPKGHPGEPAVEPFSD
jgi:hypothetical protein